jgi:hypothetical protein
MVDDQVGRHRLSDMMIIKVDHPATRGEQGGQAGLVWAAQAADCCDAGTAPGQPYAGEQGVAAVVTRTNHDHHMAPISAAARRLEQLGRAGGYSGRGPLHQRVDTLDSDGPLLDLPDLIDAIRAHDHASQITTADAMPASWDMLR